jgi:hypothetical protein
MNTIERRQYEMLGRVRNFGTTNGHLFPASSLAGENFAAVDTAIKQLDAQELAHQAASVSSRAERKSEVRQALAARVQAVAQTARVVRGGDPALLQQFEVPVSATDQALLATGRKFARDAEAFSPQFIAHGMPTTFVADLNALVNEFEAALRDRGLGREARRTARLSTKATLASGIAAVRTLHAIVINHLGGDEVTRTVWMRERRIIYPKRGEAASPPQAAPAPATPASADSKAA